MSFETPEIDAFNRELESETQQDIYNFINNHCGTDTIEGNFVFDNGEYDFETMGRFIIGEIGCDKVFEKEIKILYPDCMSDKYLIKRGQY